MKESEMSIDLSKIDNIEIDGIDTKDYPDFSDAFISSADFDGREMTELEIESLNDNESDFVHQSVLNHLF